MSRTLLVGVLALGLVACSSAAAREPEHRDADRSPVGSHALDRTLVVGTLIEATMPSSRPGRRYKPGETLTATVSADVRNAQRWIVIPAGCPVGLRIAPWGPATSKRQADATLLLDITSVTVWGREYPVSATVELTPVAVRGTSRGVGAVAPGTRILFVLREGLTVERPLEDAQARRPTGWPASK
jgi:hypothetical protein